MSIGGLVVLLVAMVPLERVARGEHCTWSFCLTLAIAQFLSFEGCLREMMCVRELTVLIWC